MDARDRNAISDLFRKLRDVEQQAGARDAEAERLIADETQRLPGAPYYMAQTIVMQDMALQAKQRELDELKQTVARGGAQGEREGEGGFLSRIFGGGAAGAAGASAPRAPNGPWGGGASQPASPYPQPGYGAAPQGYGQPGYGGQPIPPQGGRGFGGGGFLAGAAQTAMGVAGGVVLGNALGNMFAGHGFGFGGNETAAPTEVVNETTNIYEGDNNAPQDAGGFDGPAGDDGYQDASFDDGGAFDDGGGFDDV